MKQVALIGLFAAVNPCAAHAQAGASPFQRTVDERAVQAAAIDTMVASSHIRVVLVMHSTAALSMPLEPLPGMPHDAWGDFVRRAAAGIPLSELPTRVTVQYTRVSHASRPLRASVSDTAVVTLSSVGFSPSGNEAVLYIDQSCGSRCGFTAVEAYKRTGTRWVRMTQRIQSMR